MIGRRYTEKKAVVLDLWRRYLRFRGNVNDGVDVEFYKSRVEALEARKYTLAVVGETKAGKSTFINALLGERILPTDILQSTSAIVEIFKSDKKYVEVRFANGRVERIEDDPSTPDIDEAVEYLRRVGAIQDRYRKIPTTLIDMWIVEERIKQSSPVPLAELEAASGLRLEGQEELIAEYVRARTLDQIPVEITFAFPLKYAFDDLRIVDTPGVNAVGGVQDRTFQYLYSANALLFVQSIDGPIEDKAFREFITRVIPNRTKEILFLVFTKTGDKSELEIEEKLDQARSIFSRELDPDRIVHVDSVYKIMADEIVRFPTVKDLEEYYKERWAYFEQCYRQERRQEWRDEAVNYATKSRLLASALSRIGKDADCETVRSELRRLSNFDQVERMLDEFSERAPELQLIEIVNGVKLGYENQVQFLEQNVALLDKKVRHPQTFENELNNIRRQLSEYELAIHEFAEETFRKYSGAEASWRGNLERLKSEYHERIGAAQDRDEIRKLLANFHDDNQRFVDGVGDEVRGVYRKELERLGAKFLREHSIAVPTVDVDSIEAKAKEAAYREVEVPRDPEGFWEWTCVILSFGLWSPKEKVKEFDSGKFIANLKSEAASAIENLVSEDYKLISELLYKFTAEFKKAVQSLIEERRKALEELREKKAANDRILIEIEEAKKRKKEALDELTRAKEMLENLR